MKKSIPFGDKLGMKVAYSNAIAIDITDTKKMVWISGQLAFDENGNIVGENDISIQTEQCIKNIRALLEEFGGTLDDIVQVTVYVKDMSELSEIHKIRLKYFNEPYPTSTLVQITDFVNPTALIEIEASGVISTNN